MEKSLGRNGLQIAVDILSYLLKNPEAEDTLEGIVGWWLLHQEIERRVSNIKKVIDELVKEKLVLEIQSSDSSRYYRVNPEKYSEISTIIERTEGP